MVNTALTVLWLGGRDAFCVNCASDSRRSTWTVGHMARSTSPAIDIRPDRFSLSGFLFRQAQALLGFAIFLMLALAVAALATWNVADPSYSYATGNAPSNILGYSGAAFADLAMQFFGLASVIALLPVVAWALAMISGRHISRIPARLYPRKRTQARPARS